MTDQQRADLTAREGFAVDCTPALDELARSGRWFDRAYTSAPVCVPARVSLLTGRYPTAHRVRENAGAADARFEQDLFGLARQAGLRTAMIGKNHSHLTPDRADHWIEYGHHGQLSGERDQAGSDFDRWLKAHPGTTVTATPGGPERQLPARIVDRAIDWLTECGEQPSLLWLSIPEPHVPYQLPEPYFSRFTPETVPGPRTSELPSWATPAWHHVAELARRSGEAEPTTLLRGRANYVGMLRLIDDQLRRLLAHLDRTGQRSRTLIVQVADHGDFAGEYGLLRKGPGLPEVLARVPLLFNGPGVEADAASSSAHVSIVDVLPTVCELLGWPVPAGVQGRSLAPLLAGTAVPEPEFASAYVEQGVGGLPWTTDPSDPKGSTGSTDSADTLSAMTQCGSIRMVRSGDVKLVLDESGHTQLFDLAEDPSELHDLSTEPGRRDDLTRLALLMARWSIRAEDPLPVPARSYPRRRLRHGYRWLAPAPVWTETR